MFEIIHEKLHRPLNHWIRYSDGCGAQFKSEYVVADMLHATENYQVKSVSFNYFESVILKAVLIVLDQLANVHLLEVCSSHSIQFVIFMTYWLSSRMSLNNPPRSMIFS